jgi:short-subunit dehydrogenase
VSGRPLALVTGASAGIGASFAEFLAEKGHNLVIVARDKARLDERAKDLEKRFGISVEVLSADLATSEGIKKVELRIENKAVPFDVIIKSFIESSRQSESDLLDVLVRAPLRFMHAALPGMVSRGSGTIINVSSVAGWIAGGSYSAAKSFLTVMSESLHTELKGTGVVVHALCPGFTRTEFHQRGRMNMKGLPDFMWLDSRKVVADSWRAAQKGKAISVPGLQYKLLHLLISISPRKLVRSAGMGARKKQRR